MRSAPVPASLAVPALALLGALAAALSTAPARAAPDAAEPWRVERAADGSAPGGRHEAGAVAVGGRMYLLGGRAVGAGQRVDVHDPVAGTWTELGPMPLELHHFQAVAIGTEIWIVGAFTGDYPDETPVPDIHVYDVASGAWRVGGHVPEARRRGSAAATLHEDGLVYVLGGNVAGHDGGAVPWFDRFDPTTGVWETLPDAPHARDHFGAAIVAGRLVAAGGRTTELPDPFANTVAATDVYSFADGAWRTAADIPTPRGGAFAAGHGTELIVVGGEVSGVPEALDAAEAFDARTGRWRSLRPLNVGRHSGGAAVLGDRLHVAAGSDRLGGANVSVHESLGVETRAPEETADADGDGLIDAFEAEIGTDPTVADTDGDGLDDAAEVAAGTDPLLSDTDADGASDAAELARGTDPTVADPAAPRRGGSGGGGALAALALALGGLALRARRAPVNRH